jgi:Uma2 family endonuclease
MVMVASPPEQRVVLHGVSWETYESLLADHLDRSVPRFTYDHRELEILGPSVEHERDNRKLALLVEIVALELGIEVDNVGSMTFKRQDLEQGFEPATSFYVQNEDRVRGRTQITLPADPPPDLVIEMEVTRSAIPKLPLCANVGMPEVWRSDGERVIILHLVDNEYQESLSSAALPPLTSEVLTRFLIAGRTLKRTEWLHQIRDCTQSQAGS